MADGYVQAPADNGGKKVDSDEGTNSTGATIERLRVAVPDGVVISGDILDLIYRETKITNVLLAQAFDINLDTLRNSIIGEN